MTLYDVSILLGGALCALGAFLAARQMPPGKVRYIGLPRRERCGERHDKADDFRQMPSVNEVQAAARSQVIALDRMRRNTIVHAVSADTVDFLWRDYLWEQYVNRPARHHRGAFEAQEEAYALLLGAVGGAGKTHLALAERQFLEFKKEARSELQRMAKQSQMLEEQDRKIRELEQRIRQLEERPLHELADIEEKQTLQTIPKTIQ